MFDRGAWGDERVNGNGESDGKKGEGNLNATEKKHTELKSCLDTHTHERDTAEKEKEDHWTNINDTPEIRKKLEMESSTLHANQFYSSAKERKN